jgi:hypothetical protein
LELFIDRQDFPLELSVGADRYARVRTSSGE